jgi:hypothetical protein
LYDCGSEAGGRRASPLVPPPAYYAKKAKALFYTQLRPKRNLPEADLIEEGRMARFRIGFAESLELGLESGENWIHA